MDLGCFHKYIAFYAYINCCKTNSSLKRGNEKVAISNINTIISNDIQKVWNIVLAVDKYNSWRSDLSKTEIINDKQFIEYTKNGYATTFTVTVAEPYKRWEFDMENSNMKGHWIGVFIDKGNETQIDFTENVIPKKWFMKPFVKTYLEKTTKAICSGLRESIGIIKFKIGGLEMASSKDYLQFVLEQLSELQEITYRAMMGEFIIYYRGKIVGGIYDDRLLVKPTKSAISYMPTVTYEIPYENAKEMLLVEEVDNKDFLTGLFDVMYDELPTPKPKKKK